MRNVVFVCAVAAAPTPQPTATPSPTLTPTPEPTATPTPKPTATPEPTPTPAPTSTPEPTATPTPTAEEAAAARLSELVPWLQSPPDGAHDEVAGAGRLDEVAKAQWYVDGLNDEDMMLLATLWSIRKASPTMYKDLLQSYEARSRTITLPLAGKVRLWAFDPVSFREDEDPLQSMEDVARVIEAFMDEPFPESDVIMVSSHGTQYGGLGWHAGRFIYVARGRQVPLRAPTVYHEVVHYYFGGSIGPSWLVEGGATFVEAATKDAVGVETLEERRRHARMDMERICHDDGIRIIRQLNAPRASQTTGAHLCDYIMGEHILISLSLTLGEQVTSSALRDLYVLHRTEGRPVREEEIYRAFLKHTPPGLESEFRALYRRLHGGTYDEEEG